MSLIRRRILWNIWHIKISYNIDCITTKHRVGVSVTSKSAIPKCGWQPRTGMKIIKKSTLTLIICSQFRDCEYCLLKEVKMGNLVNILGQKHGCSMCFRNVFNFRPNPTAWRPRRHKYWSFFSYLNNSSAHGGIRGPAFCDWNPSRKYSCTKIYTIFFWDATSCILVPGAHP